MTDSELIPAHGGFRKLKTFQLARLLYDITARFCDRYVERRSRTRDQMEQAARSGVQNIAEGSEASGASKKIELNLTKIARASLEELRLDYEDFLRQRKLPELLSDHPALQRFKAKRCATLEDVQTWARAERRRQTASKTPHPFSSAALAANAALSLLNLCCYLLDRQVAALARAFEEQGGFSERLYRFRKKARKRKRKPPTDD